MTMKEIAKKIIKAINPGNSDISGIGDGTITGAIAGLNTKTSSLYSDLAWKTEIVDLPITSNLKYTLPDKIKTAREVLLYVGIDTINASKENKHIFPQGVAGFSYYTVAHDGYGYEYALFHNGNEIVFNSGGINGWSNGTAKLIAVLYR